MELSETGPAKKWLEQAFLTERSNAFPCYLQSRTYSLCGRLFMVSTCEQVRRHHCVAVAAEHNSKPGRGEQLEEVMLGRPPARELHPMRMCQHSCHILMVARIPASWQYDSVIFPGGQGGPALRCDAVNNNQGGSLAWNNTAGIFEVAQQHRTCRRDTGLV